MDLFVVEKSHQHRFASFCLMSFRMKSRLFLRKERNRKKSTYYCTEIKLFTFRPGFFFFPVKTVVSQTNIFGAFIDFKFLIIGIKLLYHKLKHWKFGFFQSYSKNLSWRFALNVQTDRVGPIEFTWRIFQFHQARREKWIVWLSYVRSFEWKQRQMYSINWIQRNLHISEKSSSESHYSVSSISMESHRQFVLSRQKVFNRDPRTKKVSWLENLETWNCRKTKFKLIHSVSHVFIFLFLGPKVARTWQMMWSWSMTVSCRKPSATRLPSKSLPIILSFFECFV